MVIQQGIIELAKKLALSLLKFLTHILSALFDRVVARVAGVAIFQRRLVSVWQTLLILRIRARVLADNYAFHFVHSKLRHLRLILL